MRNTELPPKLRIIWEDPKRNTSLIVCPADLPETLSQKSILAEMCTPPGGTESGQIWHDGWPEEAQKRTPLPQSRRPRAMLGSSLPGSARPAALLTGALSPAALLSQAVGLLRQVTFQCLPRACPWALERVSLLVIRSWILP